jgi:hypothetical protein
MLHRIAFVTLLAMLSIAARSSRSASWRSRRHS